MTIRKKIILGAAALLLAASAFVGVKFFTGNTRFSGKSRILYIPTGSNNRDYVMRLLKDSGWLKNSGSFDWLAQRRGCWKNLKPGRYEIKSGSSAWQLVQKLRNGRQDPVNFTITKIRTKEDLADRVAKAFECDYDDALAFVNNADSLKAYGLDSNTVMCGVIPNTYSMLWTTPASKVFKRLFNEAEKFWTPERKQKAAAKGITPHAIYTMASIVEEETLKKGDKGKIASVYFNRIKQGMPLQADPTIKFAIRNFGLSRILNVHKEAAYASPYDTYKKQGLPPGPICSPSAETIDEVLNAPDTKYIFFMAQPYLTGYSDFSATLDEHEAYRAKYNRWQDSLALARKLKAKDTATVKTP
jgi:UPF0755 protein